MKKMGVLLILCIILPLTLSSCIFTRQGDSLNAFSQRMNYYNESYNMTADGYIFDKSESSFSKYVKFGEKEIMLKFFTDSKNRTTELHLVFDTGITETDGDIKEFIENCIKAFYEDEAAAEEILELSDFYNTLSTVSNETKSAELENIRIEIDTTEIGTVVSLYKLL